MHIGSVMKNYVSTAGSEIITTKGAMDKKGGRYKERVMFYFTVSQVFILMRFSNEINSSIESRT